MRNCAEVMSGLYDAVSETEFKMTPERVEAFNELRRKLINAPVLAHHDPDLPFVLDTDASKIAIGAVLLQKHGEVERPVAFYSRKLSCAERNYSTNKRELLAIVEAVRNFLVYLLMRPFVIRTDHRSLVYYEKRNIDSG